MLRPARPLRNGDSAAAALHFLVDDSRKNDVQMGDPVRPIGRISLFQERAHAGRTIRLAGHMMLGRETDLLSLSHPLEV